MKHIKSFKVFEADDSDTHQKLEDIKFLEDLGLMSREDAKKFRRDIYAGNPTAFLNDPTLIDAFESPEFKSLQDIGYSIDSSLRQLVNGTLVLKIGEIPYKLGIFNTTKKIRRMMPTDQYGYKDQDATLKSFPEQKTVDFYKEAFAWIRDNIDHNDPSLASVRTTRSLANASAKRAETLLKFQSLWKRIGLDAKSISDLSEIVNRWSSERPASETNEILKETRNNSKKGLLFLPYWIVQLRISSLEKVIAKQNIKWTTDPYLISLDGNLGMFEKTASQFTIAQFESSIRYAKNIYLMNMEITQDTVDLLNELSDSLKKAVGEEFRVSIDTCKFNSSIQLANIYNLRRAQINSKIEITSSIDYKYLSLYSISGSGSINLVLRPDSELSLSMEVYGEWERNHLSINGINFSRLIDSVDRRQLGGRLEIKVGPNGEIKLT